MISYFLTLSMFYVIFIYFLFRYNTALEALLISDKEVVTKSVSEQFQALFMVIIE